jgi:hypothetical protein
MHQVAFLSGEDRRRTTVSEAEEFAALAAAMSLFVK